MALHSLFNIGRHHVDPPGGGGTAHVQPQRVLRRVLAFTGHTIDDVINDPLARRKVAGYYKLHHWVQRQTEIGDLERQWNRL
jgi:hypothetical protein